MVSHHKPFQEATERRIRREARSLVLRQRAGELRLAGWSYARIGEALGVSQSRAAQLVQIHAIKDSDNERARQGSGEPSDSEVTLRNEGVSHACTTEAGR